MGRRRGLPVFLMSLLVSMKLEDKCRHPCLITPDSSHDIKRLAWFEVICLSRFRGVAHPMRYTKDIDPHPNRRAYVDNGF